jgi:CHAD domain-containing protein
MADTRDPSGARSAPDPRLTPAPTSPAGGAEARAVRLVSAPADARLADDLSARLATLESAARRVRQVHDEEAVHDLRVASRRLTAALALWAPLLPERLARRARRRVRRLRRGLRTARDLEVAGAGLAARLPHADPAAKVAVEALAARLERRLAAETLRARRLVTRDRLARIRRTVERAIAGRQPAPLDVPALQAMARTHVAATRRVALDAMGAAAAHDTAPGWHQARLDIKRWRYATECARGLLGSAGGSGAGGTSGAGGGAGGAAASGVGSAGGGAGAEDPKQTALLDALKAAQESLGRVQDLVVLIGFTRARMHRAAAHGRHAETAALARFIETLAAEQRQGLAEAYRLATTLSAGATPD